jgi:hemerythrin-like domain-containing protein
VRAIYLIGGGMTATEILKNEPKIILMVLETAEREIRTLIPTGRITTDNLEKIIEFCRVFIESCHNAKEEEYLVFTGKSSTSDDGRLDHFNVL